MCKVFHYFLVISDFGTFGWESFLCLGFCSWMLSRAGHAIEKMPWALDPAVPDSVEPFKYKPNKMVKHTHSNQMAK